MVTRLQLFQHLFSGRGTSIFGEQGWRSGDRARFPPIWPGSNPRPGRHKWVEYVVGSRPCSEGFSPGPPVFLPLQRSTFLNSNSIGNSSATGLSVVWLLCATLVKEFIYLFIYLFFMGSICMCREIKYGFWVSRSLNRVSLCFILRV